MSAEQELSERERRLGEAVFACLAILSGGRVPDREELLSRYPEFAAELAEYLAGRQQLDDLATPLREAEQGISTDLVEMGTISPETTGEEPPAPGRSFGDYDLLEEIGRGGMGVVWKARQKSLNRLVALKRIKAGHLADAAEALRFRTEAETVALLDHPHVVPVYEVGSEGGEFYFSKKLVEGGTLAGALAQFRDDVRAAARLVATVARAVHHAHQRGVLHRDLKPANVLLDAAGQRHVADFGLARRIEGDASLTQTGAIVGTPSYMAPEQASGRKGVVTTATDVYGLGAILYALLTGRPPFQADTVLDTLQQVREREPERPSAGNRWVGRDLETVCLKCLRKDPRQRYDSAEALAEELERWLAGEPILARPVGQLERAWRWCRRNPAGATAVAALIVALIVSTVFGIREYWNKQEILEQQQAIRKKEQKILEKVQESAYQKGRRDQAKVQQARDALYRGHTLYQNAVRGLEALPAQQPNAAKQPDRWNREAALQEELNEGLLWMAQALEIVPANAKDLESSIRAHLQAYQRDVGHLKAILRHPSPVDIEAAAFSPDGKTIVTVVSRGLRGAGAPVEGEAYLWDAATGQPLGPNLLENVPLNDVQFSPDGRSLWAARSSRGQGILQRWDVTTGKAQGEPITHCDFISAMPISPDGKVILTAWHDRDEHGRPKTGAERCKARLWDAATGRSLGEPLRHPRLIAAAAFSPDGRMVATEDTESVRLWEVPTGKPLPLEDAGSPLALSPDARTLVCRGWATWDVTTRKPLGSRIQPHGPPGTMKINPLLFRPYGATFLTVDDHSARVWRTPTPMQGDARRIMRWAQVLTGMELDEYGAVRRLDAATQQRYAEELKQLGGSPPP